jgi:cytochrome P450
MLQTLDEMLFANLDVTAHVLCTLTGYLAQFPEVQKKLRQEIIQNERELQQYVVKRDTYLRCCVHECMRLAPISGKLVLTHMATNSS